MSDFVECRHSNDAILLVLTNKSTHNAMNTTMRDQLHNALVDLEDDPRPIILTGQGAAFCLGHDFQDEPLASPERTRQVLLAEYRPIFDAIERRPAPVIAAVNGPAIGAGFALVLASDIAICQESAFFSMPFLERGLVPDCGLFERVVACIGPRRAYALALLGDKITASRALELGFVVDITHRRDLSQAAIDLAGKMASYSPVALSGLKTLARNAGRMQQSWNSEADAQAQCTQYLLDQSSRIP